MFNITNKSMQWGGASISLEHGRIARQADAAVLVKYNGTAILVTVTLGKAGESKFSGLALVVNFIYKAYSNCKIPGGFVKREGKPSEREILAARVIDRAIRPLIPDNFPHEISLTCQPLTCDDSVIPEVPSLIGASAALKLSAVPFVKPVVAANIGFCDDNYQLNHLSDKSKLDLVMAGTKDSILMVESQAKELSEDVMLGAVMFGHENIQPVIQFIEDFTGEVGCKDKISIVPDQDATICDFLKENYRSAIEDAYKNINKQERCNALTALREEAIAKFTEEQLETVTCEFKQIEKDIVRGNIIKNDARIDGRKHNKIREIDITPDFLPQTHGSALFTRGNTQSMAIVTLGDYNDEQIVDGLQGSTREHFMLHYNFPPYSVGEAGPLRPPGRREIGHGRLAWHALQAVLPDKNSFPYTVRLVSEITESDGSSSMATVCSSSLALMVAGIPVKKHVAGIAMGLIKGGEKHVILSDILGDEDHLGDMDFKVAGTSDGVTALQMDIKVSGIDKEIMSVALEQARQGREHILGKMIKAIQKPEAELKKHAPHIITLQIDKGDIVKVIGTGGKVIKNICEVSGSKVDIEPEGRVLISGNDRQSTQKALDMVNAIIVVPKTGVVYDGEVSGIAEFGLFIRILGGVEGMVHVSEVQGGCVEGLFNMGDSVKVAVLSIGREGRIRLSMKYVDQTSGKLSAEEYAEAVKEQERNMAAKRSSPRRPGGSAPPSRNRRPGGPSDRSGGRSDRSGGRSDRSHSRGNTRPKFF